MAFNDVDQTPAENLAGYIQCMATRAIAAAVRGEIDIMDLLRAELASRGVDTNGKWVGFERAAAVATARECACG